MQLVKCSAKNSSLFELNSIFTLILSVIILGEILTLGQWLNIFVVFIGVMISQRHQELVIDVSDEVLSDVPLADDSLLAETSKRNSVPDASELRV